MNLAHRARPFQLSALTILSVGTLRAQDLAIDEGLEAVDPEFPEPVGAVLLNDANVIEDERGLLPSLTPGESSSDAEDADDGRDLRLRSKNR